LRPHFRTFVKDSNAHLLECGEHAIERFRRGSFGADLVDHVSVNQVALLGGERQQPANSFRMIVRASHATFVVHFQTAG